ncbi:MAG: MlaD family protein, partial [Pseudomonadota bacterium]
LEHAPLSQPNEDGRRLVLRSTSGRGLSAGTPILYRGIEVGRIGEPRLDDDRVSVIAEAFVAAPHDRLLTERSRFWDTSGISFSLGPSGASVDFASVTSLLRGGISFDTIVSGGDIPAEDFTFTIYDSQQDAEASLFQATTGRRIRVAVLFEDNLPGLAVGAPVTFGGLDVGEVASLSGQVDRARFGDDGVRILATLSLKFDELAMSAGMISDADVFDFLDVQVANGLRARLTSASLLTGALKVDLVDVPDSLSLQLDRSDPDLPRIPSVPADVPDPASTAEGLLSRINNLPVEAVLASAIDFLDGAAALVSGPDLNAVPGDVRDLVGDLRGVVGSEAFQDLPEQLTLITEDLRGVLADLQAEDGVAKLVAAVEQAGLAAQAVGAAAEELPDLVNQIEEVAAKAAQLDLESLLAEANGLVTDARDLVGSEAAQALPATLAEALDGVNAAAVEATALLSDLTEADAAARLTAAIETAAQAAEQIGVAADGLPDLIAEIEAVAAKANALPLEELLTQATSVTSAAQSILDTESAQALPNSLRIALDQVSGAASQAETLLADLTEAEAVTRLTAAIELAARAAAQVGTAAEGVPALIAEIQAVAAKANTLPLEEFVAQATSVATSAQTILATEAAQALPENLQRALTQVADAAGEAGALLTELTEAEAAERLTAAIETAADAASQIGTAAEGLPGLIAEIEAVATKANALPLDELIRQATAVTGSAQDLLAQETTQQLPQSLRDAFDQVGSAAAEASTLLADLTEAQAAEALTDALEAAAIAAEDVSVAVGGIPDLVTELERVATLAADLPLEQLVMDADGVLAAARDIVASEGAQALPEVVRTALESVDEAVKQAAVLFAELNDLDSAEKLVAAVEAAGQAAADVSTSVKDIPDMVAEIERVAARVNTLEFEELIREVTSLVESADRVIGDDAAQQLPESVNAALGEVTAVLEELRAGGTVENVNATLASARRAADGVADAADDLPALVARAERVLAQAQSTLATFDEGGGTNREAQNAIREISRAAEAIRSLARTIERKPNALLTGR